MKLRIVLMVLSTLFASVASASEVLVFTDSSHPVTNVGDARVIFLDRVVHIEKEMSEGLPTNIDDAERAVKERINSAEGAKKIQELSEAYQGLMQAWKMGVSKIPAVVVGGQYVVYGQPDVAFAVSIIAKKNNLPSGYKLPTESRPTLIMQPLVPKEKE
jgi:integrating conjugative element protein (TIGR03757 family)